jgi:plasmid stabilization system protein ParE
MKFDYYLSPEAEHDIDEIVTYIAQENPTAAHTFLDSGV